MKNTIILDIVKVNSAVAIAKFLDERLGHTDIDKIDDMQEMVQDISDGYVRFMYADEPYEQNIEIYIDKNGKQIVLQSNDPEAMISVYEELCKMDWGWIEV
ncbi:hypothetical protein NIE88_18755 [Sporolactobacillus shoreicorticis]|uniref:Phage protein n=1 Tax=Sporolactobacillus shoreicorticis TaxID=1923877 RepID=A0ABW5S5W8_9BACL|nr:hypothetical protein [Sporolactobacillus shoreicorticis]MCO7127790.1 hypothetical protein [Sporolactobacillus shoreicorticis]